MDPHKGTPVSHQSKNELLIHATTRMSLENMLRESSQTQKATQSTSPFTCTKVEGWEAGQWLPRAGSGSRIDVRDTGISVG